MEKNIKFPFTEKELEKCVEKREITYKDNVYLIQYHFLHCEETKEDFTTTELDQINLENLYRAANEPENVTWKECKWEKKAKMSDLFKNGDDFKFSNFDYGSKEGCKIIKELNKERMKLHKSETYRKKGWRDWRFGE